MRIRCALIVTGLSVAVVMVPAVAQDLSRVSPESTRFTELEEIVVPRA